MTIRLSLSCTLSLAAAAGAASAGQDAVIYRGPPSGPGFVEVLDLTGGLPPQTPPGLAGIRLLPAEFAGRTEIERLLLDRPRLRNDVPNASRIVLPRKRGSLYRYSRDDGASGVRFGFFVVDAAGARIVLEQLGTGAGAAQDPFVDRIAVAPRGDSFLAATLPAAGGDLLEVPLATGVAINRTSALAPQAFAGAGLAMHDAWGVAVTSTGVLRFPRPQVVDAQAVPFAAPAPTYFAGQLALSHNGQFAATIAGTGPTAERVWSFSVAGAATAVSGAPATLSGAGYLPEDLGGPFLAVSDDGSRCAWRIEGATAREAFLAEVGPSAPPPVQVTADVNFVDTLDEVGQYVFRPVTGTLLFTVGERATLAGGLEKIDVYSANLSAGGGAPVLANLTLSGAAQTPFQNSSIQPEGAAWTADAQGLLMLDRDTNSLIGWRLGQAGVTVLDTDVKSLDEVETVDGQLLLALRRESGSKPRQVVRLSAQLTSPPSVLFSSTTADALDRPALHSGWFAIVESNPPAEFVHLFDLSTGQGRILTPRQFTYGPALAFANNGDLIASIGPLGAPALFVRWPVAGIPHRLKPPTTPGFVLPGI